MSVRRRVSVIGIALAIIAAAGLWYTRPSFTAPSPMAASSQQIVLSGPFVATYDFLSPLLGWSLVVDYSSLRTRSWMFKTVDGGLHWERDYFAPALGARIYLHFFDTLHGFAYNGFAYRTVDGGVHWLRIDVPGTRPYVTFSSPLLGWAEVFGNGSPRLYRTVDAGKSWTAIGNFPIGAAVLQPTASYDTSTFRVDCEGWLGARGTGRPTVFLTTDCGTTWSGVELHLGGPVDPESPYATSLRLVGAGTVIAFEGGGNQLFSAAVSSDSGARWQGIDLPAPLESPAELSLVDPAHWWMFREGVIYTTDHAGSPWNEVFANGLPRGWVFESGQGVDGTHAWMSLVSTSQADLRSLAVTSDGGLHWHLVGTPVP